MVVHKKPALTELEKFWEVATDRPAIYALQALQRGAASVEQQQLALDFILKKICGYPGVAFDPESERNSAFMAGKQTVGRHITMLIYADMAALLARLEALRKDG